MSYPHLDHIDALLRSPSLLHDGDETRLRLRGVSEGQFTALALKSKKPPGGAPLPLTSSLGGAAGGSSVALSSRSVTGASARNNGSTSGGGGGGAPASDSAGDGGCCAGTGSAETVVCGCGRPHCRSLPELLLNGTDVMFDLPRLVALAQSGDPEGQYLLGMRYFDGAGVPQDLAVAVAWFEEAASQNHREAMDQLAQCLRDGIGGVPCDEQRAFVTFVRAADAGCAEAQVNAAECFLYECGIAPSPSDAFQYYMKAAAMQHAPGLLGAAECFMDGEGTPMDPERAVANYRKAAEMMDECAMFYTGWCLRDGIGTAQDRAHAVRWFRCAASMGHMLSMYVYADHLRRGDGVPVDKLSATRWFRQAAELGHASAELALSELQGDGTALSSLARGARPRTIRPRAARSGRAEVSVPRGASSAASPSPSPSPSSSQLALTPVPSSSGTVAGVSKVPRTAAPAAGTGTGAGAGAGASSGASRATEPGSSVAAQPPPSSSSSSGRGAAAAAGQKDGADLPRNSISALTAPPQPADGTAPIYLLLSAEEDGDPEAQYRLALWYSQRGMPDEARRWLREAADRGRLPRAQLELGNWLLLGRDGPRDLTEALTWYRRAADAGNADARYRLGVCLYRGDGCAEDKEEAVALLWSAGQQEHVDAQYFVGLCYKKGDGCLPASNREAWRWFRRAAEQGHAPAMSQLVKLRVVIQGEQKSEVVRDHLRRLDQARSAARDDLSRT